MPTFVSSCTIRYNEAGAAVPEIRFTDDWYAALAFDDTLSILSGGLQYARVPLSLGRIPCENSRQCSLYVEKLVRYEVDGMTGNPQANTVRLIAEDNRTAGGYDSFSFGLSAEHVSYMLRYAGFDLVQACVSSMPESPVDSVRTWLFDRMEAGGRYTVFFGHGAPDALTTRGLLRSGDWELFQHESLPTIFLSFSCLNGLYQLPADRSMVKSWLFSPTGGAIAYVAATAVTYTDDNLTLASRFMAFDTVRTGEYTDLGTRLYRSRSVSGRDDDYHLFGDPAIPGVRNRVPLFAGFLDETMTIRCAIDDTALSAGTFTARISAERMAEVPGNPSRTYIAVDPVHEIRGTFSAAVWDITVPAWVDTCRPDSKLRCAVYACDAGYEARQTVYLREITAGRNPMPSPLRTPAGMSVRLAGGMAEVRCTGLTRPQQVRLLLLDLAGRCVDAQPLSSDGVARFDIRLRSPGHYMVMMQGDGGPVKRPFCIYGGRR